MSKNPNAAMVFASIELQRKQQAECCVAYLPCPICYPADGTPTCPLCHGGPGAPMLVPEAKEPAPSQDLLPATRGCRGGIQFGKTDKQIADSGDDYNGGCTGCHVNYHRNERPKLPGPTLDVTLARVLATPMWKGSTVETVPSRTDASLVDSYILRHPSGAVMTLRRPGAVMTLRRPA